MSRSHGLGASTSDSDQYNEILDRLSQPDAILDPAIVQSLRQYPKLAMANLQSQRSHSMDDSRKLMQQFLQEGQALLINNYCGNIKACNLLLDWMKNVQDPKTINQTFIRILKQSVTELYREQQEAIGETADIQHEKQLIADIDDITNKYGDTAVMQRGFSLVDFEDKMKNHLVKMLQSVSESDYHRKCQRFITFCCKNDLYYLYARRLLSELREHNLSTTLDYAISNIESKLDHHTNNAQNNSKDINLSNCSRTLELSIYAKGIDFGSELRVPSMELLRKGAFTKADITKVYNYYFQHFTARKVVKIRYCSSSSSKSLEILKTSHFASWHLLSYFCRFLQNQHMIDYLYNKLFVPSTSVQIAKQYISQYIFLLNYSLCCDVRSDQKEVDKSTFDVHLKCLQKVSAICRDRNYALSLSQSAEKQNDLFSGIKRPGVARGVLIWVNHCMFVESEKYFAENFESYLTPLLVALVADIGTLHVFLRPSLTEFAYNLIYNIGDQTTSTEGTKKAATFDAKTTSFSSIKNMQVIKTMLDLVVYIIQLGEHQLVFELIFKRTNDLIKLDRSLHRHFISQIIKTCHDPLPNKFVGSLLRLMKDDHILAAIRNDAATSSLVEKFVGRHQGISHEDAGHILTQIRMSRQSAY